MDPTPEAEGLLLGGGVGPFEAAGKLLGLLVPTALTEGLLSDPDALVLGLLGLLDGQSLVSAPKGEGMGPGSPGLDGGLMGDDDNKTVGLITGVVGLKEEGPGGADMGVCKLGGLELTGGGKREGFGATLFAAKGEAGWLGVELVPGTAVSPVVSAGLLADGAVARLGTGPVEEGLPAAVAAALVLPVPDPATAIVPVKAAPRLLGLAGAAVGLVRLTWGATKAVWGLGLARMLLEEGPLGAVAAPLGLA